MRIYDKPLSLQNTKTETDGGREAVNNCVRTPWLVIQSNLLFNSFMGNLIMTKHIRESVCEREKDLLIILQSYWRFLMQIIMHVK